MRYGQIKLEDVERLEEIFATLTQKGWVIPDWLNELRENAKSHDVMDARESTITRMVDRIKSEGADEAEVMMFHECLRGLQIKDLAKVQMIFWASRRAAETAARSELMSFLWGGALLAIFMPQYFMAIAIIWVASCVKFFTGYRRIFRRLLLSGIMHLGGIALMAHAAYNLIFQ